MALLSFELELGCYETVVGFSEMAGVAGRSDLKALNRY